jgi:NADH-quinone oxidoreductase subunit J
LLQVQLPFSLNTEYSVVGSASVLGIEGHVFDSHYSDNKVMEHQLHYCLLIILSFSSFLVFMSRNPMHSLLYLVLTFFSAACILLLVNIEFLGLLYLIIYVGAIAILFLFIIMMINVKNLVRFNLYYTVGSILLGLIILGSSFYSALPSLFNNINLFSNYSAVSNIDILPLSFVFGQVLYNYYLSCILLAGLILLVALIGAIILTLNFNKFNGAEIISRQLSRSKNTLNFYKN